jgi:hypothetical protein
MSRPARRPAQETIVMIRVYDLRDDHSLVQAIQEAQADGIRRGLYKLPEHGLVGSHEWWATYEAGTIPVRTREFLMDIPVM